MPFKCSIILRVLYPKLGIKTKNLLTPFIIKATYLRYKNIQAFSGMECDVAVRGASEPTLRCQLGEQPAAGPALAQSISTLADLFVFMIPCLRT